MGIVQVSNERLKEILDSSEILTEKPSEKYKQLQEEANKCIKESMRREARAWLKASHYISD